MSLFRTFNWLFRRSFWKVYFPIHILLLNCGPLEPVVMSLDCSTFLGFTIIWELEILPMIKLDLPPIGRKSQLLVHQCKCEYGLHLNMLFDPFLTVFYLVSAVIWDGIMVLVEICWMTHLFECWIQIIISLEVRIPFLVVFILVLEPLVPLIDLNMLCHSSMLISAFWLR